MNTSKTSLAGKLAVKIVTVWLGTTLVTVNVGITNNESEAATGKIVTTINITSRERI
jgi:hypothetical protein